MSSFLSPMLHCAYGVTAAYDSLERPLNLIRTAHELDEPIGNWTGEGGVNDEGKPD